jgi:hypothetical protein
MRILFLGLMVVACGLSVRADEMLQNGDFADGDTHWHGDGKTPADFSEDNPLATADPLTAKGLIVPLNPDHWTKVTQDFHGDKNTHYLVTVTYKVSPDLTLSNKVEDYTNIPRHVRFETYETIRPFDMPPGQFFVTVSDLDGPKGYWEKFAPQLGSADTQTYQDPGQPLTPDSRKMVTVAFPPGTGKVIILSISVTSG